MRILKEQQLQEYVIEALKGSGMPVEDGYSDKIVRKNIKKVVIYEEYVLVDIFDYKVLNCTPCQGHFELV